MIAPDREIRDLRHLHAGALGELRFRAVFIEPRHGKPALARHALRVVHRDEAVRIARIADHEHAHVAGGLPLDRLPLADENLAVDPEQILALHPLLARHRADEQRPVHAGETLVEIGRRDDPMQQREGAVLELHHHALERAERRRDFDQVQIDRLIRAEHRAGSDAEEERVTDLAGRSGDGDFDGAFHKRTGGRRDSAPANHSASLQICRCRAARAGRKLRACFPRKSSSSLIERYGLIEDVQERLAAVMSFGRKLPALAAGRRKDDRLVQGVQLARLARSAKCAKAAAVFRLDADSGLVKGLAGFLCEIYQGAPPAEVAEFEPSLLESCISPITFRPRAGTGLQAVRRAVRDFAGSAPVRLFDAHNHLHDARLAA